MGTPMAPTIANIFMGYLEEKVLKKSITNNKNIIWKRYIDDIFVIWPESKDELFSFIEGINESHETIKFTYEASDKELSFLDIKMTNKEGIIHTDIHIKETDSRKYIDFKSCHPRHCLNNIPYSQALRLKRLCSEPEVFEDRIIELQSLFIDNGYPAKIVNEGINEARNISRVEALNVKEKIDNNKVVFVLDHNPSNPPIKEWLLLAHPQLALSDRMKEATPFPPIIGKRNPKNLKHLIMPSKLPKIRHNLDQDKGIKKCTYKKCVICINHLVTNNKVKSFYNKKSFNIKETMSCESTNIIYIMWCNKCQIQYVGETVNSLKSRFYQHRSNIKKQAGNCTNIINHFNITNHSLNDLKCMPLEIIRNKSNTVRKEREKHWVRVLETRFPKGLNA